MLKWYFLLNKRLFKKPGFLLILMLVPLSVAGMRMAAREDSGIVEIALCMRNPEDELSSEIVRELTEGNGILRYTLCGTEEEARALVENYKADAAWIFPENLAESIEEAASGKRARSVVTVVEREDNVTLAFVREILSRALYPAFSYAVYEDFVSNELMLPASAEELREAYGRTLTEGSFFRMEYPDGQADEEISYLLTPMRGILAVWVMLCGFAGSLYFMQDEQRGTFSGMSPRVRFRMALVMHGALLSDAAAILLIGCGAAGVFTLPGREIVSAVLFACCAAAFCNLIRLLCSTPERLGSCIPVLLTGMLTLCPVFFNTDRWKVLQYFLPPNYYLRSVHGTQYLYGMAVYTVILTVLCILISRLRERFCRDV